MSLQRVAFAYLTTSTIWTPLQASASTITSTHLIQVQLFLGAVVADPMHQLLAAKGGGVGMNAICSIALMVPLTQQLMTCYFKCGLLCFPSTSFISTTRTSAVVLHTLCNLTLPLMAADGALPLSSEGTASNRLLRCLGVLVLIPVLDLFWCFGSKRVVLACLSAFTIWASATSCAVRHSGLPDMRAS